MTDWNPSRWATAEGVERARALLSQVSLLLPVYDEPTRQTARDLRLLCALGAREIRLTSISNINCARNALTAQWYDGDDRPWSLWVNADVYSPEGVGAWVEFIDHALRRDARRVEPGSVPPIFAGAYPCKRIGGSTLACVFLDPASVVLGVGGGYHRADWIGGGAVLLHRQTVDRFAAELGIPGPGRVRYLVESRHYFGPQLWQNGLRHTDDSDPIFGGPVYEEHGEDVGLCAAAHRAAVGLLCDTRLRLDHRGEHCFSWEDALGPKRERAPSLRLDDSRQQVEAGRALEPSRIVLPSPAERAALASARR